jgi:hypothetical protein
VCSERLRDFDFDLNEDTETHTGTSVSHSLHTLTLLKYLSGKGLEKGA